MSWTDSSEATLESRESLNGMMEALVSVRLIQTRACTGVCYDRLDSACCLMLCHCLISSTNASSRSPHSLQPGAAAWHQFRSNQHIPSEHLGRTLKTHPKRAKKWWQGGKEGPDSAGGADHKT